jgi:glutamyl-tRNA reductase
MDWEIQEQLLMQATEMGLQSLIVLSTCNRTELWAFCQTEHELIHLLLNHTQGKTETFSKLGYVYNAQEALNHLFKVATGLDSQIIGDYEILGQIKNAVTVSRERNMAGPVMDRTINYAFQASKAIKTHTSLSKGTVSVSYAAVEWLQCLSNISRYRILLIGTGKFGTNIAKNLKHYFSDSDIVLMNRTDEKS